MDTLTADRPARRHAIETYRAVDAFDTLAWRAPPRGHEARATGGWSTPASAIDDFKPMPAWVVPVCGALAAAVMGLLLGGALAV